MLRLKRLKKYIGSVLFMLMLTASVSASAAKTSFLPMEDGSSFMRAPLCGVSVGDIKPFREAVMIEATPVMSHSFGSQDILFCMFLAGIYYVMRRKNSPSSVGF